MPLQVGRRLLVVEDEVGLQKLVRRRAERDGWNVVQAFTSAEGLALAASCTPEVILIDLHLPDGNGVHLVSHLKADVRTAHIPVVVWSGSDVVEGETEALAAGAEGYFEKTNLKAILLMLDQLSKGGYKER
jgi:two-component system cell cycle response regulator DivK